MGFLGFIVGAFIVGFLMKVYQYSLGNLGKKLTWLKVIKYLLISLPFIFLCTAIFTDGEDVIGGFTVLSTPFIIWNIFILVNCLPKNKQNESFSGAWARLKTDLKEAKKEFSKISVDVVTPSKAKSSDVTFMYEDNNGDSNMESVYPYEVTPDYISGFCNKKGKDRKFYHDRIDFYFDNGEEIIRNMMNEYYEEERRAKRSTIENLSASSNDPNTINFIYQDSEGNTTKRSVIIKSVDYEYFTGICLDRHAERTFKKDRVVEYLGNAKQLLQNFVPTKKKKSAPKKNTKSPALTINFVGFSDDEQMLLEALAKPYNLKVLKTQTKTLFAIITNEELPEKQAERATENGTLIMNKEQFLHFLETGEV
ncbi:hypothetical protein [Wohlfahrtiimonas larvae]|uniref:BRCT domain-containing protein n=2 Tax=Wohlfahrtiimonas larvae TaxID=1157986 RepID=A0ABP9MPG7_9GAMM